MGKSLENRIFNISTPDDFNELALDIFKYQAIHNKIYKKYLDLLGFNHTGINNIKEIPFLPIELFKHHMIISGNLPSQLVFESSGTTSLTRSKHYIVNRNLYDASLTNCFRLFYGEPENYCILALLPSYLERQNSSLVYMAQRLIGLSGHNHSGFYLDDLQKLAFTIQDLNKNAQKILLLGVSFGLLDLAEKYPGKLNHAIIMETGGMKGKREEMTRNELHEILKNKFQAENIHSEYGMTELLSQAYSKGNGVFYTPPWMRILIRDTYDAFSYMPDGKSGGINIVDLANIHSCSFIATHDIGKLNPDGGFEVLGRFDDSEIRGCNLMLE